MANIPKSKDATEEALSAIQEALNIRAPETHTGTPFEPVAESNAAAASTPPAGELFPQEAPPAGWPTGETVPRRAANDDRAGIGQILQALRYRSGRAPDIAAAVVSFIWAVGGIAIATLYGAEMRSVFATPGVGLAAIVALAAAIAVPVIFFSCSPTCSTAPRICVSSLNPWPKWRCALHNPRPLRTSRLSPWARRSAAKSQLWAMVSNGLLPAPPSSKRWCTTKSRRSSAPTTTTRYAFRDLFTELTNQRRTLVNQAEHVRNAIASVHLISRTTLPRSAILLRVRAMRWRNA
jgi:hypothetical protein